MTAEALEYRSDKSRAENKAYEDKAGRWKGYTSLHSGAGKGSNRRPEDRERFEHNFDHIDWDR